MLVQIRYEGSETIVFSQSSRQADVRILQRKYTISSVLLDEFVRLI
jgi:hypothetical protein